MKNEKQKFCKIFFLGGGGGGQIRFIMGDVQVANRGIDLCFIKGISVILILRCGISVSSSPAVCGFSSF